MDPQESTSSDKSALFDNSFREYVRKCEDVIKENHGDKNDLDLDRNMAALDTYFRLYKKMDCSSHFQYFEKIYAVNRSKILNSDDEWITKGDIIIQLGGLTPTGNESTDEKRRKVRIYVSDIYNISCLIRDRTKELFSDIDIEYIGEKGKLDMQGPDILLLSIMKIFFHLVPNDDKVFLVNIINKLEDKVGILIKTAMPVLSSNTTNNNGGGGFSGLFSIARTIMESSGIKPPPEMKTPTDEDVSRSINAVFQNQGTKNVIQKMVTSLQGCNDIGSAINTVITDIANPTTIGALQTSIQQTAQQAVNNNNSHFDNIVDKPDVQ